ncbi:MAG: branched-chain-amino-acid transaminase [Acidobacteria bacterium]|uniref:Branched-chain-amino-acid aminotransferase n=1 Tax=Candidatus Polarisedimenticola svalbardensis TaxID=2886004 RepID=A0A8J6Y6T1_9BACT|nr:branched-chain-amino-acid transaminase [Candidatus Polarisedimenticola svalbardensis]
MQIYLNGKLVSKEEATVSVMDHGFLYGDGTFEGIRVYGGNIYRLKEHIQRLYESMKTLELDSGLTFDEMCQATIDTVAANGKKDVYIRLVVSRGKGDLGIDPAKCDKATVVIIVDDIALYPKELYDNGISLITASTRRVPIDCIDPRIKSLNYLNNILAKIEAKKAGVPEAIMLNHAGCVAECTADNIFMVKNGVVKTPDLLQGALGGITRASVIELAKKRGMQVEERALALHDFYNADEVFLTGTGAEIIGVVDIDKRTIGTGKPGQVTMDLLADYQVLRTQDGAKVDYDRVAETV